MKKIEKEEFELRGQWIFENGKVVENETAQRINYLKDNYLEKIAIASSGWEILYKDPSDMRYWELTFPQSEVQGGGPPTLYNISKEIAIEKYGI
jgi:hypothetical protein